jgi:hypothetical protein
MAMFWLVMVVVLLALGMVRLARLVRDDGYGVEPPPRDRPGGALPSRPYALRR